MIQELGCPAGCGGLWRPVAACGGLWRGSRGPTRRLHESWRPGAWTPGGKDDEDEDADE